MFWRVLIQCWFALLAMVLPSQVMACAQDNERTVLPSLDFPLSQGQTINHDWLLDSASTPAIPSSQSHITHRSYAILNHTRSAPTQRVLTGFGSDIPFDFDADEPQLGAVSRPLFIAIRYSNRSYDFFTSTHRLAGWKESNAMYVALNSQYS